MKNNKVMAITTHGRDAPLTEILKKIEKNTSVEFMYVKKTAPSLRNLLVRSKESSLGCPLGKTTACKKRRCMTCKLVSNLDFVYGPDQRIIKTAVGQCDSRCLIYHARCVLCTKKYVGKTITQLNERINGHRKKYYDCLMYQGDRRDLEDDDRHLLGLHLFFEHGLREKGGFNASFKFTVLENCSPNDIDLKEHLWIHRLRTIKPYGINSHDPFGISLLL